MLKEIIERTSPNNVEKLMSGAQQMMRSDAENPADQEQQQELAGEEEGCCYSVTKYFRISHY